jgi:hypothetical protein
VGLTKGQGSGASPSPQPSPDLRPALWQPPPGKRRQQQHPSMDEAPTSATACGGFEGGGSRTDDAGVYAEGAPPEAQSSITREREEARRLADALLSGTSRIDALLEGGGEDSGTAAARDVVKQEEAAALAIEPPTALGGDGERSVEPAAPAAAEPAAEQREEEGDADGSDAKDAFEGVDGGGGFFANLFSGFGGVGGKAGSTAEAAEAGGDAQDVQGQAQTPPRRGRPVAASPQSSRRRRTQSPLPRGGASDTEILSNALTSGVSRAFAAELVGLVEGVSAGRAPGVGRACHGSNAVEGVAMDDDAAAGGALLTCERLRERMMESLGATAFEEAHARLREAAASSGGEFDDALAAGGVQRLLGDGHLEVLPMMLKLLFLEARTQQNAPW